MALGRGSALLCITLSVLLIVASSTHLINAEEYTVGDNEEWNLGVNYTVWAANYKFVVGDSLRFKYVSAAHNVYQVSEAAYGMCDGSKAIKEYDQTGNTVVELTEAMTYYFLCAIPTHCEFGMKVAVSVTAGSTQAPTSTPSEKQAPTSTPSEKQAPMSTPSSATPPTDKSSGTSLFITSPRQLPLLFSSSLAALFLAVFF